MCLKNLASDMGLPFRNMKVYMSKREALDFGLCLEKITIVSLLLFLAHIEVIVEHRFIVGDLWVELMVKWWFWITCPADHGLAGGP